MKFFAVKGEVKSRSIKELDLSFAMRIPENREMNESPKTAMPGVSLPISKSDTGMFDCIMESSRRRTIGKPKPKARLILSLIISL